MYQVPVFISHSWSYSGHYETLAEWIFSGEWQVNNVPIDFQDVSIPKDDPIHDAPTAPELAAAIYERIDLAAVVVIPTGMYANYSDWIQLEIDGSRKLGRPILAVNPWGQERKSSVVAESADLLVGWNKQTVVDGVWQIRRRQ